MPDATGAARRRGILASPTVKNPCYQITEFRSWGELAQLFEPYYRDSALPEDVVTHIERLAAQPNPADQAVEWLRFVQRELRYFALSFGEGGLVPRSLEAIWGGRFGDCKDAVRLYVAGARRLGLDACAALVSTTHGLSLGDFLPSTQVFNHLIVRLRLQGATYWLDPTMQRQGGSLGTLVQPHAGWALPLTPETTELERLPDAKPLQHVHCDDVIQLGPKPDSPATLHRRIDFRYWTADTVRNGIENEGAAKLSAQLLQDLQRTWPRIVETASMSLEDDLATNQLRALFRYEIRDCWKRRDDKQRWEFHVADNFTTKELGALKSTRRHSDILLGHPRKATWRARLEMPVHWRGTGWRQALKESGIQLRSELTIGNKSVLIERELVINSWSVPAAEADAYARIITTLGRNVTQLWARVRFGGIRPAARAQLSKRWRLILIVVWLLIVLLNIVSNLGNR